MARIVVALGAVGLVVGLALTFSARSATWLGSNGVPRAQWVYVIDAGKEFCQDSIDVPPGAGTIRMRIGTHDQPGPPMTVRILEGENTLTRGSVARGWPSGDIDVNFNPLDDGFENARVCVYNDGPTRLALAGIDGLMGAQFYTRERRSWWGQFGILRDRFAEGRSTWFGAWSLYVALGLVLAAAALGLATMWRVRP